MSSETLKDLDVHGGLQSWWSENKEKPFHNIQPREEHSPGDRRVYNQEKTSPEQTQRWWSENKEKPFHNIQPREELSPGDRRVYNQEKTSPEQTQRWWSEDLLSFTTSSQEKNTLQETDVSTIKRRLHQSKHRGDDRRIFSLSQHPAKRRTLSRRQTCLQSREDFTRANTEVMIGGSSLFHNIQPREEHSPGDRRVYNQEKTSPEQTQRWWSEDPLSFTTSSQEKNTLQETDVSTIKRRLHQSKHRGDDRRIFSLSQHPAKRRTLSRRQTCLQSREDFTRANTEVMIGGSSLFHNIQPREEHSPGDRRVYNQEKTSPEQTQRWWSEDLLSFTTSSQEKNTLQETDVSTIKRRLHQSKHTGDDRRILSLSQHPAKRRTLSRRQTCLQSREDFTRANTEMMIGGSSLFHNIQPREEHSPGDRRVYNQEKTSPEQTQRWWSEDPLYFTTSSQEKNTLQETDVSTIKRRLHQSKHRGDDRRIFSLSQHPAKRRTLSRRQTCLQSREDFTRANTEMMIRGSSLFHNIQPREEHSPGDRRVYNQEKTSPEQTQRWWSEDPLSFTTSSQEKNTLQETDVSTIKRRLHQSKHRDDDRRILSLSQHPAKRRTLSRRQTCLQSREDFTRANTEMMIGGSSLFHNIQPREEHSPGDRRVYNQEKTSPEQTQRWWSEDPLSFTTSSQEKNTLQETDVSTIKRRLHQSKHRGDDRRILSLSQHPAKRRTLSRRQTCLQSREDFTRANTEVMIGGSSLFHNIQPREEHSPGDRRVYNQEKTSPEQTQRWWSEDPLSFTTSSQEKNTLQETDVSTIKRRLHQSKHRGDDRRILSLSQHPAKRRTLSRRQTCLQSREDFTRANTEMMIGGSSLFHNIQTREELSPGDRRVYNQEKTSPEQTQRWWSEDPLSFTTSSQEKNTLQETDVSTIKRRLHQSKHRGDDRRIFSLSQHPAKRRTLSRRQTCLQSREDFTRANTEVMIGGSSLFHNIQPREEHSPGDRRVYNQEKTSPEQTQRWWSEDLLSFTTSSQEKNTLQETDVSTIKRRLHQSKHRGDDRRILSLSQHPAKRRTLSRRQTCLQSREDFTRANTEVMIGGSSLFHNIQPREEHSPGDRRVYNQEKTSPEQTQRWWSEDLLSFTTSSQEKNTLQETDVSTIKRRLHQSKHRGDDRRILSLSQHPAKRRTLSRRQTCLQSREDFTRANTEVMIGGSSLFHNIQPREEHSPGDRRVYNQEKTSPEQTQRWWSEDPLSFTTSSQEKNTLQETDVSTIKRRLHQSKHRGDDRRILSLSQHPAKRRTLSRRQTCLQSREDFTRASPQAANKAWLDFTI